MQPAVAKNEIGACVITSSPGPMSSAISATSSASVPDETPMACGTPRRAATSRSKAVDFGAHDEALAVADARERVEQRLAEGRVLRLEIEERNRHKHLIVLGRRPPCNSGAGHPRLALAHLLSGR